MSHLMEGIESLPPEILNMICKYLNWRDVGNFEKALPQISVSGAELDAVKRSLKEISIKKNVVVEEIDHIGDEIDRMKEHYSYIIFHLHYFDLHYSTPTDIANSIRDIKMLENHEMCKEREKLDLEVEMQEICRWWLNE